MAKSETAFARKPKVYEALGERFPNPVVHARFGRDTMPQTGDNVAAEHGIGREEAGRFALASQKKYDEGATAGFFDGEIAPVRSEEHTSELQSLMRISYAVFCLKKKIQEQHYRP